MCGAMVCARYYLGRVTVCALRGLANRKKVGRRQYPRGAVLTGQTEGLSGPPAGTAELTLHESPGEGEGLLRQKKQ